MSKLLSNFDKLMSHLNAEENDMAEQLKSQLEKYVKEAEDNGLWRQCLENGGVDNWSWYSEALSEGGYYGDEDEEDEDDE